VGAFVGCVGRFDVREEFINFSFDIELFQQLRLAFDLFGGKSRLFVRYDGSGWHGSESPVDETWRGIPVVHTSNDVLFPILTMRYQGSFRVALNFLPGHEYKEVWRIVQFLELVFSFSFKMLYSFRKIVIDNIVNIDSPAHFVFLFGKRPAMFFLGSGILLLSLVSPP